MLLRSLGVLMVVTLTMRASAAENPPPPTELLDRWLRAQNQRDLLAYDKLYAPDFSGVRRSGPRTVQLDRAGWMRDRARMFKGTMTVEAKNVRVTVTGSHASVRFTQLFATPTYSDEGDKRLELDRAGDGWLIAREEMLGSAIDEEKKATGKRVLDLDHFAFVENGRLVIDDDVADERARSLVHGSLHRQKTNLVVELTVALSTRQSRALLGQLRGRRVRVFGDDGPTCEATVADRVTLRFVTDRYSDGVKSGPEGIEALDSDESTVVARRLTAELVNPSASCASGRWARAVDLPVDIRYPKPSHDPVARAALRRLPQYGASQREYEKQRAELVSRGDIEKPAPESWDDLPDAVQLRTFAANGTKPELVWVQADAGEWCGGIFHASSWAFVEKRGAQTFVRESGPPDHPYDGFAWIQPVALVDLDGDGVDELIVKEGESGHTLVGAAVLYLRDGRYRLGDGLTELRTTCHC